MAAFYGKDLAAKKQLVDNVRNCCLYNGFFQITGHNVPLDLQERVLACSKRFFALPLAEKQKISKDNNSYNRGYELLRSQILEAGTEPELKEGLYIGDEISETHPYYVQKKLNSGPNQWPEHIADLDEFKSTTMEYYRATCALAKDVFKVMAQTLDLPSDHFEKFCSGSVANVRFLHYPPQPADSDSKLARGIGAHTDFGTITLLLQDEVDGLQVYDKKTDTWLGVTPIRGAYVVNLGNLFQRWTNDRYKSNLHRVINKSGEERYSIPLFFNGDPDFVCECLPNCISEGEAPKYPPISVTEAIMGGYRDSYGRAKAYNAKENVGEAVTVE